MMSQASGKHTLVLSPPSATRPADPNHVRYCLYARKSSEEDERQAMSIDSQIKEMMEIANRDGIDIVEVRQESHSAKYSTARPVFNQLLSDIRLHMFTGIMTWAPDRLSRNAGDLGALVDMMDQGHLLEIRTHSQRFTGNPNDKFLLMILGSQAKLENDNRGINVQRGQRARASTGYRPCLTPLGYTIERRAGETKSRVIIDPERAPIVKQIFQMVAERGISIRQLALWSRGVADFRTRKGKFVTMSIIQRMLHNAFYTGTFEYPQKSGKWFKGDYEPLITKELFDEVQKMIQFSSRGNGGWGVKEFRFVRFMRCGLCGSGVTPVEKKKVLIDGSVSRYVYYRCNQNKTLVCKEPAIREEDLLDQLLILLDQVNLDAVGLTEKLETEMSRFEKFAKGVLGMPLEERVGFRKVDSRHFALYLLTEGSPDEKRDLLAHLKNRILLENGYIRLVPAEEPQVPVVVQNS
jgi:site-specific DNA recombinase